MAIVAIRVVVVAVGLVGELKLGRRRFVDGVLLMLLMVLVEHLWLELYLLLLYNRILLFASFPMRMYILSLYIPMPLITLIRLISL